MTELSPRHTPRYVTEPVKRSPFEWLRAALRLWLLGTTAPTVEPAPRPPISITFEDLAKASHQSGAGLLTPLGGSPPQRLTARETFRIPEPPPGVPAAAKLAMDEAWGSTYDYAGSGAWGAGNQYWGEGLGFLGYPYLAELTQRPEYRIISEIIAKEMTREWIELKSTGDDDNADRIEKLNDAIKRYRLQDHFREAAEQDGFFGRSQIYIDTGQGEDVEALKLPLPVSPKSIKKGSLVGFKVIEPLWTYPNAYNTSDPLSDNYFKPTTWFVQAKLIHSSRLLIFVGREMPDLLKPAYAFGGLSRSQMAKPYVDNWLRTRQSVSDLVHAFSVQVLSTDMSTTTQATAPGSMSLIDRIMFFNLTRDNRGMMVVNRDTEELTNISTPLNTLDTLQAQSQEQMCSVSHTPVVKLLGLTPTGLNTSTDGEIRSFYDWIKSEQQHLFRDNLKRAIDIIQLSEFGDIDETVVFEFVPLWQLDAAAKATINKTNIDADVEAINAGVISPEEARERLAHDEASEYQNIDLSGPPPDPPEMQDPEMLSDPARGAEPKSEERSGV